MIKEIKDKIEQVKSTIDLGFGVEYNHYNTLKRIYFYQNSKNLSGSFDPLTKKNKPFPNISRFRARIVAKMLDFDLKDIRVISNRVFDFWASLKSFLLERKIREWAKENNFGFLLNSIVKNVADYGSCVVLKIPKQKPEIIDLKSIFFDPTIETIKNADWIVLEKELNKNDIFNKKDVWQKTDEILYLLEKNKKNKLKFYFYFFADKNKKTLQIFSDVLQNNKENNKDGILVYEQELDEFPFVDFHINKVNGRWLGVGTYEELFEPQIRLLTISGLKARALELASKTIFQTPDRVNINYKNFGSDLETGDVIVGNFVPLQTETRALSQFRTEEEFWNVLSDRLTFTYDVIRGEGLPATTPATNATIQSQMATSSFEQLRENLAFQIVDFIKKYVLEDIKKDVGKEFVMRFTGSMEEIGKFDEIISSFGKDIYVKHILETTGFYPSDADSLVERIKNELKNFGLIRSVKIPKGFFNDLNDIDIIIDTEARNVPVEVSNLNTLIQILASNPQALDNPLIKGLVYSYSEKIGISPVELDNIKGRQNSNINETANLGQIEAGLSEYSGKQGLGSNTGFSVGIRR